MKFEFGDLYKFIVSLGVILISFSALVPWLFLKEPFDLFKSEAELKAVSEVARAAIINRQETVGFIVKSIPWVSSIGCLCGLIFIYLGLTKWYANQLLLDEQTKVEVELKKQSLRDATKDEIALAAARDLSEQVVRDLQSNEYALSAFEASYAQTEGMVATHLSKVYASKYDVESNKMVGGIELDILLRGRQMLTKDFIIEVKSIRRGFNYGWLRESFLKNIYAKNIYAQVTSRMPNTLLLIITEFKSESAEKYSVLLSKVADDGLGRKGKDRVVMIDKSEFQTLSSEQLQERLGIYA